MRPATLAVLLLALALPQSGPAQAQRFTQTNLVSDLSGQALRTDAHLVNPWGLVPGASGVFWTSNNENGTSTLYNPDGTVRSLVVAIPGGNPTGIVATAATDSAFDVPNGATSARAAFIFVTQSGTVAAWSPAVNPTNAIQVASNAGAVYTGAALGGTATDPLLYAADFAGGKVDVYDSSFTLRTLGGTFTDPNLPAGYYPFNVANVGDQLFVAYAQKDQATGDELAGVGLGVIDAFDLNGVFIRRVVTGGELNAPWAIVQAPAGWGPLGGDLIVGNFGDGRILAYDFTTGVFVSALRNPAGAAIEVEGLWGLAFGLPVSGAEVAQRLYFAAGIEDETHGLFGFVALADTTGGPPVTCDNDGADARGLGFWKQVCGGPVNEHANGNAFGRGFGDRTGRFGHGFGDRPVGFGRGHEDGDDDDDGDGRGGPHQFPADSLDALFACIESGVAPNAFGPGGCFTAGCDLLRKVGWRSNGERAAQTLLSARLNLCSGAVCEDLPIACDDAHDGVRFLTFGEVADSLDGLLCDDGDGSSVRALASLLRCAIDGEDGDDDDGDDDGDDDHDRNLPSAVVQKIGVKTMGVQPARMADGPVVLAISAAQPSFVQLRIYDARGRLIAEPMHASMVVGSATVPWDGKDLAGRTVTPGMYFYRAVSGGDAASGRLMLVR